MTHDSVAVEASTDENGVVSMAGLTAAVGEVLEAAIPLQHLTRNGELVTAVGIVCEIFESGNETERFPHQGEVICAL